ncbi:DUF2919 family protein [Salmonella enterica subsp. enterica serovar London]|nr:DUF2919 family protein [Salmonella enterica]EBU9565733.1 hypothetical protein [Salmonella enterica subsp. enterica serovar London]ECI2746698.1 DUF2919 family protein [Salmonella enterica subsp. enterica]EBQ2955507.1 DUF2919 family protein [Salmonella enterica]ECB4377164.1 DUF2919 family protein [Salmonella enterica subsp. enterica serovar London]
MRGEGMMQKPRKYYRAEDYDHEGNLKAPWLMWAGVAWLLLPCWLTAVGVVSGSTPQMAEILYPTLTGAVMSLVLSLPVLMLCAVYPLRGRYERFSRLTLGAVYLSQMVETARLASLLLSADGWHTDEADLVMSCVCVYSAVLLWMVLTPRLWTVFGAGR